MALTDEELMVRFGAGEQSAFVVLLQRFKPQLIDFAAYIVRNRETAEDIAQETFLRVFRAKASYRPTGKFSTWLYTIATNLCYDELRKRRRLVSLEAVLGHPPTAEDQLDRARVGRSRPHPPPDTQVEQMELSRMVEEILRSLSREHREVILLRIDEGLGYAEAAERLGRSVGTVKSRMHYAMKRLRDEMVKRL